MYKKKNLVNGECKAQLHKPPSVVGILSFIYHHSHPTLRTSQHVNKRASALDWFHHLAKNVIMQLLKDKMLHSPPAVNHLYLHRHFSKSGCSLLQESRRYCSHKQELQQHEIRLGKDLVWQKRIFSFQLRKPEIRNWDMFSLCPEISPL